MWHYLYFQHRVKCVKTHHRSWSISEISSFKFIFILELWPWAWALDFGQTVMTSSLILFFFTCHFIVTHFMSSSLSFYQDSSPRNLPGVSNSLSRRGACPYQGPEDAVVSQISPLPCTRKVVAFLKAVFYTQVLHRSYFFDILS